MSEQEQGSQESKSWRCECTYLHGQRQHGQAKTGIRPVRQAVWADRQSTSIFVPFGSGHLAHPREKLGQEVDGIAHCCFRRLRGYKGTLDEVSKQAGNTTHTAMTANTLLPGLERGQGGVQR